MMEQHFNSIQETSSFLFAEELNTVQKLPFHQFSLIAAGSTFIVTSLHPIYDRGVSRSYGSNLSKGIVCKRLRRIDDPRAMKSQLEAVVNEVIALSYPTMREHENVIDLMGLWWENNPSGGCPLPVLIMELAEFGTLADLQSCPLTLRYATKLRLCLDVALGLEATHDAGIVHSDLKSENVLVFEHPDRGYIAKLSDFGSTTEGGHLVNMGGESLANVLTIEDTRHLLQLPVVTFPWNAPEYYSAAENTNLRLMDIYSLGLLAWRVMLDGESPFASLGFTGGSLEFRKEIEDLKTSGKLLEVAKKSLPLQFECEVVAQDLSLGTILDLFDCTLRLSPKERNLDKAIKCMGGEPSLHNLMRMENEIFDFGFTTDSMTRKFGKVPRKWDGYSLLMTPREDTSAASYAAKRCFAMAMERPEAPKWSELLDSLLGDVFPDGQIDLEAILNQLSVSLAHIQPDKEDITRFQYWFGRIADHLTIFYFQTLSALALNMETLSKSAMYETLKSIAMRDCSTLLGTSLRDLVEPYREDAIRSSRARFGGIGLNHLKDIPFNLEEPSQAEIWIQSELPAHHKRDQPQAFKSVNSLWASKDPRNNLLHLAAMYGYTEIVLLLLEKLRFDIDYANFFGERPLHLAMRSGHHEIARMLIEKSAAVTKRDATRATPLHWISKLDEKMIKPILVLFLDAGADIDAVAGIDLENDSDEDNDLDSSIADSAMSSGTSSQLGMSWDEVFFASSVFGSPLHVAVANNCATAVTALCEHGADVTLTCHQGTIKMQIDPLQLAILLHLPDLAAIMISYYPQDDSTAARLGMLLGIASAPRVNGRRICIHGSEYLSSKELTIKWCLQQRPLESWIEELPLHLFARTSDCRTVEILFDCGLFSSQLEHRAPFRGYQLTSLQTALAQGKYDMFALLLKKGANINSLLDQDSTSNCLHLAACTGLQSEELINLILSHLDPELLDSPGDCFTSFQTAFMLAVQQGNFSFASMLRDHGANIEATSTCQFTSSMATPMTILGHLARQGFETSLAQLKFLLSGEKGPKASFIVAPAAGFTAIHAAALCPPDRQNFNGTSMVLEYLLSLYLRDEEINATDAFGCTALHLATIFENHEAVQLLLAHGANPHIRDTGGSGLTALEYAGINHSLAYSSLTERGQEVINHPVSTRIGRTSSILDLLQSCHEARSGNPRETALTSHLVERILGKASEFVSTSLQLWITQLNEGKKIVEIAPSFEILVADYAFVDVGTQTVAEPSSTLGSSNLSDRSTADPPLHIATWLLYIGRWIELSTIKVPVQDSEGDVCFQDLEISLEVLSGSLMSPPKQCNIVSRGSFVPDNDQRPITQRFIELTKQIYAIIDS